MRFCHQRESLPTSFGRLHVAPKLKSFLDTYPDLRLQVDLDDEFVDLAAGHFDVAVRIGTLPDSTLIARRIAPNRRVLCASPGYLERFGTPRVLADLSQHRLLAAEPQTAWRFEGPEGPVNYKPQEEQHITELGKGSIPWQPLISQARAQGVKLAFLDQDETKLPVFESMKESFDYLNGLKLS